MTARPVPVEVHDMSERPVITVYSDYKSPYAYLAKDLAYALETECAVTVD